MRDEKEGRKKQARSNKQQGKAHPRQSFSQRKMSCLGWDSNPPTLYTVDRALYMYYMYIYFHVFSTLHTMIVTTFIFSMYVCVFCRQAEIVPFFTVVERERDVADMILDYSISQTTLEEVFLNVCNRSSTSVDTASCGSLRLVVGACGWLWEPAAGCGSLRLVVGACGWLWEPAAGCGSLRLVVGACGWLWEPAAGCGSLRLVVGACGWLWEPAAGCGSWLWEPAAGCGSLRLAVGACGWLWEPAAGCGSWLWEPAAGCGRLLTYHQL